MTQNRKSSNLTDAAIVAAVTVSPMWFLLSQARMETLLPLHSFGRGLFLTRATVKTFYSDLVACFCFRYTWTNQHSFLYFDRYCLISVRTAAFLSWWGVPPLSPHTHIYSRPPWHRPFEATPPHQPLSQHAQSVAALFSYAVSLQSSCLCRIIRSD